MKKLILYIFVLAVWVDFVYSQNEKYDSMAVGRKCQVILFNGFQAEGVIENKNTDTLWLKSDITTFKIPIKDIRFVSEQDVDISEVIENEKIKNKPYKPPPVTVDTTEECDVYLQKSLLKDVKLFYVDTTLYFLKVTKEKEIKYSDVRKIVFKPVAPFGKGYLYGAAAGFLVGFFTMAFSGESGHGNYNSIGGGILSGLVFSVPFGLLGGVVGLLAESDKVYYFDAGENPAKIKSIKYIIVKHKQ